MFRSGTANTYLSGNKQLGSLDELAAVCALDREAYGPPVCPLHLLRGSQQQTGKRREALKDDEHDVNRVRDLARVAILRVQAKVNRAANELSTDAERQPQAEELSLVLRLRVRQGDRRLGLARER